MALLQTLILAMHVPIDSYNTLYVCTFKHILFIHAIITGTNKGFAGLNEQGEKEPALINACMYYYYSFALIKHTWPGTAD